MPTDPNNFVDPFLFDPDDPPETPLGRMPEEIYEELERRRERRIRTRRGGSEEAEPE